MFRLEDFDAESATSAMHGESIEYKTHLNRYRQQNESFSDVHFRGFPGQRAYTATMHIAVKPGRKTDWLRPAVGYLILAGVLIRLAIEAGSHPALAYGCAVLSVLMFAFNLAEIYQRKSTVWVIASFSGSLAAIGLLDSVPLKVIAVAALVGLDFGLLPAWSRSRQSQK